MTNPVAAHSRSGAYLGQGWHSRPFLVAGGSITFTRANERTKTITFNGTVSTSKGTSHEFYNSALDCTIVVNGNQVAQEYMTHSGAVGSANISGSFEADSNGSVSIQYHCNDGGYHSCTSTDGNFSNQEVGSFNLSALPYNPEVPPTNISGGRVYNQNNVVNGNDKPDWNFYIDWWGESAGTHSITKVNLDLYKSTNLNSIVATVDNVKKWTRYNFENLLPKCKPGETYEFYTNVLVDGNRWLRKSSYRNYKIIQRWNSIRKKV